MRIGPRPVAAEWSGCRASSTSSRIRSRRADVAVARDGERLVLDHDDEIDGRDHRVVQRRRGLSLCDLDVEAGGDGGETVEHAGEESEPRRQHERHPQPPVVTHDRLTLRVATSRSRSRSAVGAAR